MVAKRLGLAGALVSLACSGGAGGSGGTGGTGGNQSGGTGGISGPLLTLPQCLVDLLSACPPTQPCVEATNDAGQETACYGGVEGGTGVRAIFTPSKDPAMDCGFNGGTTVVTKADGSPCYSFEQHEPQSQDCGARTWLWFDAAGYGVASGSLNFYTQTAEIACEVSHAQTSCTLGSQSISTTCCNVSFDGSPSCQDGVHLPSCAAGACP